jgi:hypothetical protein
MTYPYTFPINRFIDEQLVSDMHLNPLSDAINYPPSLLVERTTVQSMAVGATTWKNVSWETAPINNDTMWVIGNPTALSFKRAFTARIVAKVQWATTTAAIKLDLQIIKTSGSVVLGFSSILGTAHADGSPQQVVSKPHAFITGDLVLVRAKHSDAVARNLVVTDDKCWAEVEYLHSGAYGTA